MNCDDQRALLIHHAYAELGPSERASLSRHLARCSACALEYCRLLADIDGIQASLEEPPAALGRQVRAALERELRPRGMRRIAVALRRPIPAYALGAALLLPIALWGRPVDRESGNPSDADPSPPAASANVPAPGGPHAPPAAVNAASPQPPHNQNRYDAAGPVLAANPIL
jgi:anti-sigma factor RsiW